jgi:hypothetical protein
MTRKILLILFVTSIGVLAHAQENCSAISYNLAARDVTYGPYQAYIAEGQENRRCVLLPCFFGRLCSSLFRRNDVDGVTAFEHSAVRFRGTEMSNLQHGYSPAIQRVRNASQ